MSENVQGRALAIFMDAIEKPEAQRLEFVQAACDSEALLRELLSLLASHARAGDFLGSPAADMSLPAVSDDKPAATLPATSEGPGTRIGRYKLLQKIGEGGFGSVFMAEQGHPVRRRVALKIIKLGMDTKQVIARFEAERQALAMMDHANIARVFDAGATDAGRPYFVMELVRGVPITDYCDTHNLSTGERLELFIPVCIAVQHAHQKGIIHRDIKPSNVMVTLGDGKPVPKVIDFGIAKATNARLTEKTYFTEYRQFIGTPQYMSPEQAEMTGIDIDTRSDIYSLGVLLYELLTGTTPLDAKELRSLAYEEIRRTIREVEPPKPSTRLSGLGDSATKIAQHRKTEPRKLGQLLRGELDWIVMRALEKDRTRRYDTPGNLAADIQRHLDNEPVLARPPSAVYGMRKFVIRHRVSVSAGTAVLIALVVGSTLATIGLIRAESALKIADAARIDAQSQRAVADKERVESQLQKVKAEDQKQLAVDNARNAELKFAEGLISQADAWSSAKRFLEAHQFYVEAHDKFIELREPLTAAEAGLWSSYRQTTFPLLGLGGHTRGAASVAISLDGRTALSGSSNENGLKLWDLASGEEVCTLAGHASQVNCVAMGPNGRIAISGNTDGTLNLWDLVSRKELSTMSDLTDKKYDDRLRAHMERAIYSVAIAPDGQTALSGRGDGTLERWNLANGMVLRSFPGHTAEVGGIAIGSDGRTALSASFDNTLKLWDLVSGRELRTFTGHIGPVQGVAIAPDGRTALSCSWDNTLKLWDLDSGKELRTFAGDSDWVISVAITPDGRTALSGDHIGALKLWDLASGIELRTFTGHTTAVQSIAISPDGQIALSGGLNTTLKLWSLTRGMEPRTFTGHTARVTSVAITPDGRTALSGSWDHTLRLWDLASGKDLRTITGWRAVVAPDSRTVLSYGDGYTLKLWDLTGENEPRTLTGHTSRVTTVAVAPDGRTAMSGSHDGALKLWDLASGKELRTLTGHTDGVGCVAFAPDGRTALSGGFDTMLRLWDLASGKELRTFTGDPFGVLSVAISPNGRTALSGGIDNTLKLWDLASGKKLRTLTGHTRQVTAVAIAPDGRTVLSGSDDNTLKLWDLASGKELRTLTGHTGGVECVAFAPDGQAALSGSDDSTLKIWDFARGPAELAFEPRVAAAQAMLQQSPNDPGALETLGEWYAFRGMDKWAVELLIRARDGGAAVAPLTLARCYWNLDQNADAGREFKLALEQSKDSKEQTYLGWCIQAIDRELEVQAATRASPATQPATAPSSDGPKAQTQP